MKRIMYSGTGLLVLLLAFIAFNMASNVLLPGARLDVEGQVVHRDVITEFFGQAVYLYHGLLYFPLGTGARSWSPATRKDTWIDGTRGDSSGGTQTSISRATARLAASVCPSGSDRHPRIRRRI